MFSSFRKEEPARIQFHFDGDQVSLDDIIYIEHIQQGKPSAEELKMLMCHFLVDDKGKYMTEEQAGKILGKLKRQELVDVQERFVEAIQESSIPKASGNGSNSPSNPGQAETFPDGLVS